MFKAKFLPFSIDCELRFVLYLTHSELYYIRKSYFDETRITTSVYRQLFCDPSSPMHCNNKI